MSLTRTRRYGISYMVAIALFTICVAPAMAQDAPAAAPKVAVTGGVDLVNQYMFRGIRQNSTGMATWPWLDVRINAFEGDGGLKSVGINIGSWNSAHSKPGAWYESDFYTTLGLGFGGGVTLSTTYTSYTSPDDAFTHVKELAGKLAIADGEYLGRAALNPYVLVAFELATEPGRFQADGGENAGKYVELGIAPGYSGSYASLSVPVKVGLSAGDYYELDGVDNKFGFFSVGSMVTVPVGSHFNVHGGVEFQALGDTTKALNQGDGSQVIGSFGIGLSY